MKTKVTLLSIIVLMLFSFKGYSQTDSSLADQDSVAYDSVLVQQILNKYPADEFFPALFAESARNTSLGITLSSVTADSVIVNVPNFGPVSFKYIIVSDLTGIKSLHISKSFLAIGEILSAQGLCEHSFNETHVFLEENVTQAVEGPIYDGVFEACRRAAFNDYIDCVGRSFMGMDLFKNCQKKYEQEVSKCTKFAMILETIFEN